MSNTKTVDSIVLKALNDRIPTRANKIMTACEKQLARAGIEDPARAVDRSLQRMRKKNTIEFIGGVGSGWRVRTATGAGAIGRK